ncbi:DDRGK domain-containing protein 1-like, partial [Saccostrea cucullata]|uniref:DDRGK domain-containing protein 1-like n=1 Tax=Saccostrea cuccullata TaxID=36930 RepID=UPI002ED219CD
MAVDQATVYLVMMAIVGIIMLLASIFCKDNSKGKRGERDGGRQPAARARDENLPAGVRRRGRRNRMANRGDESDEDDLPNDPDEFNPFEDFEGEEKKIGKKKMLKLQAKEERKQQRL